MPRHLKEWFMGAAAAVTCIAVYAIALGFFLSLTLLVASMEEGGGNLSDSAPVLTQAIILLSQGVGFSAGSVTLTLMPLMLTGLLIALLATLVQRLNAISWRSGTSGAVLWLVVMLLMANGLSLTLSDPLWLIAIKSLAIYTLGYSFGAIPRSSWPGILCRWWRERVSSRLRQALRSGFFLGFSILAGYLLIGVVTVLLWTVTNYQAMGRVFQLSGMQIGSRILTTICSLAWLPNLCLWATSWVFGAGFSIGDVGTFTLWTGESTSLPPLPVFGLLPSAVSNDTTRMTLISIPFAVGVIVGLLALLLGRGFAIRFVAPRDGRRGLIDMLINLAYAAGAFCLAGTVLALGAAAMFQLSVGSLGRQRLRHIGVDVISSTRAVGHPTALGLLSAWLLVAVGIAGGYGVRLLVARIHTRLATGPIDSPDTVDVEDAEDHKDHADADAANGRSAAATPRRLASDPKPVQSGSSSNTRVIISMAPSKEDHDEDNTATDTQSSGISLP